MEAIGQLTGGIAHDFNNLLTAIIGSLEIASRRASDKSVMRLIDNALRGAAAWRGLNAADARLCAASELDVQPVDIPSLVRGMSEMLERSLGPSVLIETRFPLRLQWVKTDPNQLEMAVLNLIVNARDAMPEGGPIVVAARPETLAAGQGLLGPGSYVCLSVTDTGEGMDEETLSKAMDPFFTTKEVGKGTGLGLPMVHGLAEQSGGELVLKSRKGQGTTAELWLPVAKSPLSEQPRLKRLRHPETASPSLTALVVDDDPLVLTNMAAMLDDLGHTVFEATSAREALAILRRENAIQLVTDRSGHAAHDRPAIDRRNQNRLAGPAGDFGDGFCRAAAEHRPVANHPRQAVPAIRSGTSRESGVKGPERAPRRAVPRASKLVLCRSER